MAEWHTTGDVDQITRFVEVDAPPSGATAYFLFGTNQRAPVEVAARDYRAGNAPLIIATGGVNRHNGVVEAREFERLLIAAGVDETAIRVEDRSANTRENVEFALEHLREALAQVGAVTAVCKWYHRRAIHWLMTLAPELPRLHAVTFEPVYSGVPVTRRNWPSHPDGERRVVREWQEVRRRVDEGGFVDLARVDGAWLRR